MAEAPDPILGQTIGGFVAERLLGEGGFARVYLARKVADGRPAALKILAGRSNRRGSEEVRRFEREAKLVAMLRAPGTIRVLGHGQDGEHFFIAFEHVDGESLDEVIRRGPLAPHHVELIFRTLLQSLDEAHRLGVLHRDLKPANVMLDRVGQPKLLDFGVAHVQADVLQLTAELTRAGTILGTVQYMAPENLREQQLVPASDLYSLGLIVYEMLTGKPAVQPGPVFDMMRQHLEETSFSLPPGPWPESLRAATNACLRKPLAARPQNAAQVVALLEGAATAPLSNRPQTEAPSRLPRYGVAALAVGILVAGLVGYLTSSDEAPVVARPEVAGPSALLKGGVRDEPKSPSGRHVPACSPDATPELGPRALERYEGVVQRGWYAYAPTSYRAGTKHPAVLFFHDLRKPTRAALFDTNLPELADREGFVVLAFGDPGVHRPWDTVDAAALQDDIAETRKTYCLDDARIFAVGHGSGGRAAEWLACSMKLTGIATTATPQHVGDAPCEPYEPTPYLQISPLDDGFVPVEGGIGCGMSEKLPLNEKEALWRQRNRCSGVERERSVHVDGACVTWDCEAPFVACRIEGGHLWKGMTDLVTGRPECGVPSDFPRGEVIWSFFESLMHAPEEAGASDADSG